MSTRKNPDRPTPPASSRRLLRRLLPDADREHLIRDLDELYAHRLAERGEGSARRWYRFQAAGFAVRLCVAGAARFTTRFLGATIRPGGRMRFAARRLLRRPGHAATSILTLGLGVGGIATVHAAAEWTLLRPVPGVRSPDRLVMFQLASTENDRTVSSPVSQPDLETLRERLAPLVALAASSPEDIDVDAGGIPVREPAEIVSPDYFEVLGVTAVVGRLFRPADHSANAGPPEVVVSHSVWQRLLGGRPDAAGTDIRLNGHPYTVIGVTPRGFHGAVLSARAGIWVTTSAVTDVQPQTGSRALTSRYSPMWQTLVGRLTSNGAMGPVEAEANTVVEGIRKEYPMSSFILPDLAFRVWPGIGLEPGFRAPVRRSLMLLAGASLLLLLLAVANVGNLGLARAASRRSESAVHMALGAGRLRIALDTLAESLLIAVGGAAVALPVVVAGSRVFAGASFSKDAGSLAGMSLDGTVALVAFGIAVIAGLTAGLAPAVVVGRERAIAELSGHRHGGLATARIRGALVVVQVALSTVLVISAVLLARTISNLRNIDLGFRPDHAVAFSTEPGLHGLDDDAMHAFVEGVRQRLTDVPGVLSAGAVYPEILQGWSVTTRVHRQGAATEQDAIAVASLKGTSGLIDALGLRLLAGRDFPAGRTAQDDDRTVVVSESVARRAFPTADLASVVGRTLEGTGRNAEMRIVGIVNDANLWSVEEQDRPFILRPWPEWIDGGQATILIRLAGRPNDAFDRIRAAVREVDPTLPIYDLRSVRGQVDQLLAGQLTMARLALALAILGLFLAGIGLHGVLSYTVTERRREIGVRTALGARPARLLASVVLRGLGLTGTGVGVGFLGSAWAGQLIQNRLHEMSALDLTSYTTGLLILAAVALLASGWPAWRAMSVSPMETLRSD